MNRKTFQFASLVLWFVSLAAGTIAESALACNVPPPPTNPPPVRIRFKTPTTVQLRIGGYATFGVGPGQFCACGLRTAGLGTITGVTRARIFSAGTNTPVSGFSFAPNDTTTASFNGLQPGNWQAFFTPIDTPVAPGIATDIVFDVTVVDGSTFAGVAADVAAGSTSGGVGGDLRAGTIGTAEANADGTVMNDMDLNLVTPGDLTQWNFAYTANSRSSSSTFFSQDATNGPLSRNSEFPLQGNPAGLAFVPGATDDANADWMLFAFALASRVEVDRVDRDTGALTPAVAVPCGGIGCEDEVTYLTLPQGGDAFIAVADTTSNNVAAFRLNRATGTLTQVQSVPTGPNPRQITAYTVAGQSYLATANDSGSVSVFSVNSQTGMLTPVQDFPTGGTGTLWVATNSTGTLGFTANAGSNNISVFAIDQVTGAWSLLGTFPAGGLGPSSVAVDPSGQFVIVTNLLSNSGAVFRINPDNTLTLTSTFTTGVAPFSVKFTPGANPFLYVVDTGSGDVAGFALNADGTVTPTSGSPYPAGTGSRKLEFAVPR